MPLSDGKRHRKLWIDITAGKQRLPRGIRTAAAVRQSTKQAHPHLKGPGPGPHPDATHVQKGPRFPRFTGDRIRPLALTVNVSQHDDEQQRFPGKSDNRTHFCLMANHFHRQL